MARALLERGDDITILDSLERGYKEALDKSAKFEQIDIKDKNSVEDLFKHNEFESILHFAGYISVEESTKIPELYEQNNVVGSENLFKAAIAAGVEKFIFSSTAAVYGNPIKIPIPEDHPKNPTSPYGESKLKVEKILANLQRENPHIAFACLRYFNACGGALDGSLGENHIPETHIIPLAIKAVIANSNFNLFGSDYDTPDGTCVRDYIHVLDLVEAHILALEMLGKAAGSYFYNVGTGLSYSNRQVISAIEKVSGKKINILEKARRSGDPGQLVADPSKIKKELNFIPKYSDLETIIQSAWKWHSQNSELKVQNSK